MLEARLSRRPQKINQTRACVLPWRRGLPRAPLNVSCSICPEGGKRHRRSVLSQQELTCLLSSVPLAGLVHVGDELREVNGVSVIHKRPDEISQLLVRLQVYQHGSQPYG